MPNTRSRLTINPPVFATSVVLLVLLLGFGIFFTKTAQEVFPKVLLAVSAWGGWFYVAGTAGFIVVALWLLCSRFAGIRLGADDERPDFSTFSWFAMLFSAGMGIGLVFYGVAEPMMHYVALPGVESRSVESGGLAVPVALFHWGIHAWAIYVMMGLAVAYFAFRKGLPLAIRSCFHPLLGRRIHGWAGHAVDILAVLGTLFGLATSLGLGAMQVSAGLSTVWGLPHTLNTQLVLIAVITLVATISLVTGLHRGIRRLSELNLIIAAVLLAFVFAVGPTGKLVPALFENVVGYGRQLGLRTFGFSLLSGESAEWSRSWTIFYWGWWISWAPFVGMFVARISRGRTIREFILATLLVPTAVCVVWFTVFGNTALHLEQLSGGISEAVSADVATAVYAMLAQLPLAPVTSLLAVVLVSVFFVTSSDSASFVVDMLTSGGHPNPPRWQRVFWAGAEGACAAILLYAGGKQGLKALQAAVISIGLPFCLVLILITISLLKALRHERHR